MPLCFIALIGVPLFLSLGWTNARFSELAQLETAIIALDNASIIWGREMRSVFQGLQASNARIAALEKAHHAAHACARTPIAPAGCLEADLAWEAHLRLLHALSEQSAVAQWQEGEKRARGEAWKQGVSLFIYRVPRPALRPVVCAVCGLPTRWEVAVLPSSKIAAHIFERRVQNRIDAVGQSLLREEKWQYRVREVQGVF